MQPLIVCNSCGRARIKFGDLNNQQLCEDCYGKLNSIDEVTNDIDFIAIDFEIANNKMSSACSLGMAFVKDHDIIHEKYFLIQPPSLEFDKETTKIHGLTADNVRNERKFDEIWTEISSHFTFTPIIAHNAQFDMSVLYSCLTEYSLELPNFEYIDSITLSTKACNGQGIGNSLIERLDYFGIEHNEHHNAMADARACAQLVIACMKSKKRKTLHTYLSMFGKGITVRNFSDLKPQTHFIKRNRFKANRIAISEISVTVDTIRTDHPFFGKNIVFTGDLNTLDRKDAMQRVVNLGGMVKSGISGKTDYLVVGTQDKSVVGENGTSTKEAKAYSLIEQGKEINIINEHTFLKLINDY